MRVRLGRLWRATRLQRWRAALGFSALGAVVVAIECTGSPASGQSHGVKTPLGVSSGSASPSASANPEASERKMALEDFTPMLARPELAEASEMVEASRPAGAVLAVEKALAATPPSAGDVKRWQYLLGRLREQAGDLNGAAASYDLAAAEIWPLTDYAKLGSGRVLLRAGLHEKGLERLVSISPELPIIGETRLLVAEAADRLGRRTLAMEAWRSYLASDDAPRDWMKVALHLAEALVAEAAERKNDGATDGDVRPLLSEALRTARRVRLEAAAQPVTRSKGENLEDKALAALAPADRRRLEPLTGADELSLLRSLVEARQEKAALETAESLLQKLPPSERWGPVGCEAVVLRAKAYDLQRRRGKAADSLADAIIKCKGDDDRLARLLYLAGKYSSLDNRHAAAIRRFQDLEKKVPKHRLADDARLLAALSYMKLGDEARFTELLSAIAEDYPGGDMVLDGMFQLAMRRIEKDDWSGAASVLDRAARFVEGHDNERGTEFSGRERYFRARAWMETGEEARGYDELEAIVRELPLSYYMLHAYARLAERDGVRAAKAREEAIEKSSSEAFEFKHQPEFDQPAFARAMELLSQGEIERGKHEIAELGIAKRGAAPGILWGVALLYARAGAAKHSHGVARGLLTDWLARWPAGDWSKAWEIAFPRPFHRLVQIEAKRNDVPESLIYGVMREESAFDPNALSPANAHGLMQLMQGTAAMYSKRLGLPATPTALKRPSVNIAFGSRVLSSLTSRFKTNPLLAIPGYNAGPGRPVRWLKERPHVDFDVWVELIPFRETRRYTKRVLASRAAYAVLYEPETAEEAIRLPIKLER